MKYLIKWIGISICAVLYAACETPGELSELGSGFVEENSRVVFIDTFSLQSSTILLDSLSTSGTGQILVGAYEDDVFGKITCSSYFQIRYGSLLSQNLEYIVDSVEFILTYTGYYEGDTNLIQSLKIHRLIEEIEADDQGLLYNIDRFDSDPIAWGSTSFRPSPQDGNTLSIRLPDELGLEWMEILTQQNAELITLNDFIDLYKGVVLSPGEIDQTAVLGFHASELDNDNIDEVSVPSSVLPIIRIHYQEIGEVPEVKTYDLTLHNQQLQFNSIQTDRSMTLLADLDEPEYSLSSANADDMIFLQSSVGILPKIEFPDVESLYFLGEGAILQAELVIEPVKGTYSRNNLLAENLILYQTDRNNRIGDVLLNPNTGGIIYGILESDYVYQETTTYRFPITDYMNEILSTDEFTENAVLIGFPDIRFQSSIEAQVFGGPLHRSHNVRLELYYVINSEDE